MVVVFEHKLAGDPLKANLSRAGFCSVAGQEMQRRLHAGGVALNSISLFWFQIEFSRS